MKRAIVGTAGHIDHGKTRLIEALTGVDCDRWAEEKERGITIDLGFAHLEDDDLQLGFVDVPGHERFLHNALAGLGGIRIMLLVVAADEGVKPQTREHLAICSLLGIPAGLVVLTKSDLVSQDLIDLATLEVDDLLAATPFAGASVHAVSSISGEGIEQVRADLFDLARQHAVVADPDSPTRLPVDRSFLLKGLGLVVTGTLSAGEIRAGDVLEHGVEGGRVRVRSVQVHGKPRDLACAGERTALQLTGADHRDLARGDQLLAPDAFAETRRLLGSFRLLPEAPKALRGWTQARFHLMAAEVGARIRPIQPTVLEPGGEGLVELRLSAPTPAVVGDRFIIRRPSPPLTLGGGCILDPAWRPRRGKALPPALDAAHSGGDALLRLWVSQEGEAGLSTAPMAKRLGRTGAWLEPTLRELEQSQKLLAVPAGPGHGPRWLDPAVYQRIAKRAKRVLSEYFRQERLAEGMSRAEAVERILPGRAAELTDVYLDWLNRQKILSLDAGTVTLPGRSAALSTEESSLSNRIVEIFDQAGLQPPSPNELRDRTQAKPQTQEGVVTYLIGRRRLVRLPGGLIIAASAVQQLTDDLRTADWQEFSISQFKERFDLTRKWAIPLLEQLDSTGVTRRVGGKRQVIRS